MPTNGGGAAMDSFESIFGLVCVSESAPVDRLYRVSPRHDLFRRMNLTAIAQGSALMTNIGLDLGCREFAEGGRAFLD
jgi:hypothetical protein